MKNLTNLTNMNLNQYKKQLMTILTLFVTSVVLLVLSLLIVIVALLSNDNATTVPLIGYTFAATSAVMLICAGIHLVRTIIILMKQYYNTNVNRLIELLFKPSRKDITND